MHNFISIGTVFNYDTSSALLLLLIRFYSHSFTGTAYFQETTPFLILSGFCVYSVASALFMFPALYGYFSRALDMYTFEHADGAGQASDLVIQPFVRFISMAFFPVVICAGVLYLLVRYYFTISYQGIGMSRFQTIVYPIHSWLTEIAGTS